MIVQEIKKHPIDFSCLAAIFLVGLAAFFSFSHLPEIQKTIVVFTGLGYFFWGIVHHWQEGDLSLKVIIEYFVFAVLGIWAAFFLVLRE